MAKIVFWLGAAPEPWDPLTALETGIGGSETAAIHMSRQLALLGHEVTVYSDYPSQFIDADDEGQFPHTVDVEWRDYRSYGEGDRSCDLFISSRQPEARRKLLPRCRQAWLWMHDLHCGPDWDNVIGTDYDRVLCLSNWAKERFVAYYPGVDASKIFVSSNGLDLSLFENGMLRAGNQHVAPVARATISFRAASPLRVTWSSSPDRGLDRLLDFWPKIYEQYGSNARLQVYYGFETWKRLATLHGLTGEMSRIALLEGRLAAMADQGVVFYGRRGQQEIAQSYLLSKLWLYPTSFEEISCITAMEAQAAGCKIVATRCGALPETAPGAWFVEGPTNTKDYEKRFLESVHEALLDDSVFVKTPRTWRQVAEEWNGWLP